jgi:hypothetical protein
MMLALATNVTAVAAAAAPPAAYVEAAGARVPLAITSWCWDARCGAPLGSSARRVSVTRGAHVRIELKLEALDATVTVGGTQTRTSVRAREVTFAATRSGGISALVHFRRGWVVYTVRLAVR